MVALYCNGTGICSVMHDAMNVTYVIYYYYYFFHLFIYLFL